MKTPESSSSLSEQIARLQQRQRELVQQTAEELDQLQKQVEASGIDERKIREERESFQAEIRRLEETVLILQEENQAKESQLSGLESWFHDYQRQVREIFIAGESLFSQTPVFTRKETRKSKAAKKEPIAIASYVQTPLLGAQEEKPKKIRRERKPLSKGTRRLALRFAVLLLVVGGGYVGIKKIGSHGSPVVAQTPETGKVAGVSTDSSIANAPGAPIADDYAESFADLPFDQTKWESSTDSDFGLSLEFPSNTTNRIHAVGGSNLWFLRKSGYLLKITKVASVDQGLDQWVDENKADYANTKEYNLSKSTFKGQPAWWAQPNSHGTTSGYQYIIKHGSSIYVFWIKEEPPTTDDGQRLARMITSIQFTN